MGDGETSRPSVGEETGVCPIRSETLWATQKDECPFPDTSCGGLTALAVRNCRGTHGRFLGGACLGGGQTLGRQNGLAVPDRSCLGSFWNFSDDEDSAGLWRTGPRTGSRFARDPSGGQSRPKMRIGCSSHKFRLNIIWLANQ